MCEYASWDGEGVLEKGLGMAYWVLWLRIDLLCGGMHMQTAVVATDIHCGSVGNTTTTYIHAR